MVRLRALHTVTTFFYRWQQLCLIHWIFEWFILLGGLSENSPFGDKCFSLDTNGASQIPVHFRQSY